MENKYPGKFIVIEGIDGSGKATQANLLAEEFKRQGYVVEKIDFPQYGKKSAGSVEEYLNGKYGPSEEVGPYRASVFYACDRYDLGFTIKKWLSEGKIVISDRYVSSNVGHQGGKIKDEKEWEKFVDWLYNLEYGIFQIPKPDVVFLLKTSADYSIKM
ncbi:MAG: deoxynucleoside kinase, partial [Candidatus Nealsonbacteria bacterium]|nr:deoxynucleoside kinase [Candidatus Nealsonbacteria bacterium]